MQDQKFMILINMFTIVNMLERLLSICVLHIYVSLFAFLQIFLGKIVSRVAPSYQVVGSENSSLLSRDPEQVTPSPKYY